MSIERSCSFSNPDVVNHLPSSRAGSVIDLLNDMQALRPFCRDSYWSKQEDSLILLRRLHKQGANLHRSNPALKAFVDEFFAATTGDLGFSVKVTAASQQTATLHAASQTRIGTNGHCNHAQICDDS